MARVFDEDRVGRKPVPLRDDLLSEFGVVKPLAQHIDDVGLFVVHEEGDAGGIVVSSLDLAAQSQLCTI